MRLIKKFQDFKSKNGQQKEDQIEKPYQKSDSEIRPERKTDDRSKQGPSSVVVIPGWENY